MQLQAAEGTPKICTHMLIILLHLHIYISSALACSFFFQSQALCRPCNPQCFRTSCLCTSSSCTSSCTTSCTASALYLHELFVHALHHPALHLARHLARHLHYICTSCLCMHFIILQFIMFTCNHCNCRRQRVSSKICPTHMPVFLPDPGPVPTMQPTVISHELFVHALHHVFMQPLHLQTAEGKLQDLPDPGPVPTAQQPLLQRFRIPKPDQQTTLSGACKC